MLGAQKLQKEVVMTGQSGSSELSQVGKMVRAIVLALVDNEARVLVTEVTGTHSVVIEVDVDRPDRGKVIGKKGAHAKAIRKIVEAAGGKAKKRYLLEIIED
jgi:uncharacterized protein